MMLDKLIEPDSLRAEPGGASLGLRLPWYRALPLSTVDIDEVLVDGAPQAPDGLRLALNGQAWPVAALRGLTDQYWFVTDTGRLHLGAGPWRPGERREVQVLLSFYPPYIRGLRRAVRFARTLEVR